MADMSQDDLDSIFGGEEGSEAPPAEVSSEESVENLFCLLYTTDAADE